MKIIVLHDRFSNEPVIIRVDAITAIKEEHIKQLKKLKPFHNGSYGASINFAIDTMRKYQKIEQILKDIPHGGYVNAVRRIREVVEDGNDD